MARPRVLFSSYHCHHDASSGAAACTRDLFDLLTARGWACGVVSGPFLDFHHAGPIDVQLESRAGVRHARGEAGGLTYSLYHDTTAGYPVTVFSPDPRAVARPPSAAEAGVFAGVVEWACRQFRPDIILTYGGDPASVAAADRGRAAGARVVFWLHNYAYTDAALFRRCNAVIVPSEASRTHYRALLGIDPVVLPGPWEWGRLVCDAVTPRFVTFVNPEPSKGVFWFARIAALLGRSRPDIPLLVVEGRGGVDWLSRCGVDLAGIRSVHRMRTTTDPRRFYRVSKIVLMPSLIQESFGRVAAEAMANGIPIIGSDRGGLAETLAREGYPHCCAHLATATTS